MNSFIELREIQPDVRTAMWWLEKVDKIDIVEEDEDLYKDPPLGAPQNEREAELMEGLLNRHFNYIERKE